MTIASQEYWNTIGISKDFEDPLYIDKLKPYLKSDSRIVEYGCGYGRLLNILKSYGYDNLIGYDFAIKMIERGKKVNPHLDLRLLAELGKIPCKTESIDALAMSTVLCCMVDSKEQFLLLEEITRVLKEGGILYLSDFLICNDARYKDKYAEGYKKFGIQGIYTTSENLTVRHFRDKDIFELLKNFDVEWFEQFDFKTMNNNPARTFHCIARKSIILPAFRV